MEKKMENPNTNSERRAVTGFTGLQFKAIGKILLTQGPVDSLTIQADPEIRVRIHTEVKEGVLMVTYDSDWKDWTGFNLIDKGMTLFTITMREIQSLSISGVGNLDVAEVTADKLNVSLSGPGSITIGSLTVNNLVVDMAGVGAVDLGGKCLEQTVHLSGAGNYKAPRLESDRATVKLSGVGNATVWVKEALDVNIPGAGAVEYYGSPQISQKISGIGVLKYLGNR
jgi:hypothetical protein